MKKLITIMLILVLATCVKAQTFGEFFMNPSNNDFWPVTELANSNSDMIWVMHMEPKTLVGDTLYTRVSTERRRWLGSNNIPCGFINGNRLNVLTDSTDYWNIYNDIVDIEIEGDFYLNSEMQTQLTWTINTNSGERAYIYLTENKCYGNWPNGNYQNVVLYMFGEGVNEGHKGLDASKQIDITTLFNTDWNADSVNLIIMVTNIWGDVIGARKMPLKESVTTGIETINMKLKATIWPNPAINKIKFSDNLTFQSIIDYQGKTVKVNFFNGNEIDISHLRPGLYMILFKEKSLKFIKK